MALPLYILGALVTFALPSLAGDPASPASSTASARSDEGTKPDRSKWAELEKGLAGDLDPYRSEEFLKDKALQARLKTEDPELYNRLFLAATQSRDMLSLLATHKEAETLRLALASREGMTLANDPQALLEWMGKNADYIDPKRVREALWDWDTLSESQRKWLAAQKQPQGSWEKMSFPDRQRLMSKWGTGLYDSAMKAAPKSAADLSAMRSQAIESWGALNHSQRVLLSERLEKAGAAVKSLADAEKRLSGVKDPKLQTMLAQARSAGSLEDTLSRIGGIFDGLGVNNASLAAARPSSPGQSFTDSDRRVVSDMLKTGLMRELAGTTAGDRLIAFYAGGKNPLKLTVADMGSSLAEYRPDTQTIALSQNHVERYLKTVELKASQDIKDASGKVVTKKGETVKTGITIEELKTNPEAFRGLVWEVAPCFAHEGIHHMQDVWGRQNGLPPYWYDQGMEIETKSLEGLFVLQKSSRDPAYRKFLEARQDSSDLVKEDLRLAQELQRDPVEFRNSVRKHNYPGLHSTESQAWAISNNEDWYLKVYREELSRREKLGAAQQQALQKGPAEFPKGELSYADWRKALSGIRTGTLSQLAGMHSANQSQVPGFYQMFRDRYDGVDAEVEAELSKLEEEPATEASTSRVNGTIYVPVPGVSGTAKKKKK